MIMDHSSSYHREVLKRNQQERIKNSNYVEVDHVLRDFETCGQQVFGQRHVCCIKPFSSRGRPLMIDHTACCGDHPVVGADGSSQIFRYPIFFLFQPYQHRTRFFFIRCISYPFKYLQKVYIEEATKTKFKTFIFASMMLRSQHLWQQHAACFLGFSPVGPFPFRRQGPPTCLKRWAWREKREQGISWFNWPKMGNSAIHAQFLSVFLVGCFLRCFFCTLIFGKMIEGWNMFFMHFFPVRSFWTLKKSIPF